MNLKRSRALLASAVVSLAWGALESPLSKVAFAAMDANAFSQPWSGEYYAEEDEKLFEDSFESYESKRDHYLIPHATESPEEFLEVARRNVIPPASPSPVPSGIPSPIPPPFPYGWKGLNPDVTRPSPLKGPLPFPARELEPPPVDSRPQAFYFYNSGYLRNSSRLPDDGRGFVKVFRDRERTWATRAVVDAIQTVARIVFHRLPGRERIQVADLSGVKGGHIGHASHRNGLDADIIFLRKSRKEQPEYGGFGRNGFAEQFVVPGPVTYRKYRDSDGKERVKKVYSRKVSNNFDVEANFELLRIFDEKSDVKEFFVDRYLIKELFRYAENQGLSQYPSIRTMLMKMSHQPGHADHFHMRLNCQPTDPHCVSGVGYMPRRK